MSEPVSDVTEPAAEGAPAEGAPAEIETHAGAPVTWSHGQEVVHPTIDTYLETIRALKEEGYVLCADVTGVDYLERPVRVMPSGVARERFEVVVNLVSLDPPRRIRVRLQVPEASPTVPSLFALFPGTEAFEREVFDLMGIRFEDHPDLTRILMPEDWEGHPLRKDYPVGRVPVQFKAAPPTR